MHLWYHIFYKNRIIYRKCQKDQIIQEHSGFFSPAVKNIPEYTCQKKYRQQTATPVILHTDLHKTQSQFFECYSRHFFLLSMVSSQFPMMPEMRSIQALPKNKPGHTKIPAAYKAHRELRRKAFSSAPSPEGLPY